MKRLIFVLALSLFGNCFAAFPNASIKNFKGEYRDLRGSATANSFIFEEYDFGDNPDFEVIKDGESLLLRAGEEEFKVDKLPLFADSVERLQWDGINIKSTEDKIDIGLASFIGQQVDSMMKIKNLRLICEHSGLEGSSEYLDSCVNNKGHLSFSSIETATNKGTSNIGKFSISASGKRFKFSIKASAKVKGSGRIRYEGNKVIIKVEKAKSGMFSVVGRLFKELNKLRSAKIEVSRPYIKITL